MIYEDRSADMSRQLQSFVHSDSCKCEICKVPQLKFSMFQIGCHYSRLLWLMEKFDVSLSFNRFAIDPWRSVCDKLRRVKDGDFLMINKIDFAVFSIRWLFQCADTLIRTENFQDVEEVYQEVELILTVNIPDFECFKQTLHCRKENLSFLLEHGLIEDKKLKTSELSFTQFAKLKKEPNNAKPAKKSPSPPIIVQYTPPLTSITIPKTQDIIYVDESDDDESNNSTKARSASKKPEANPEKTPKPSSSRVIRKPTQTPRPVAVVKARTQPTPKPLASRTASAEIDLTIDGGIAKRTRRQKL